MVKTIYNSIGDNESKTASGISQSGLINKMALGHTAAAAGAQKRQAPGAHPLGPTWGKRAGSGESATKSIGAT